MDSSKWYRRLLVCFLILSIICYFTTAHNTIQNSTNDFNNTTNVSSQQINFEPQQSIRPILTQPIEPEDSLPTVIPSPVPQINSPYPPLTEAESQTVVITNSAIIPFNIKALQTFNNTISLVPTAYNFTFTVSMPMESVQDEWIAPRLYTTVELPYHLALTPQTTTFRPNWAAPYIYYPCTKYDPTTRTIEFTEIALSFNRALRERAFNATIGETAVATITFTCPINQEFYLTQQYPQISTILDAKFKIYPVPISMATTPLYQFTEYFPQPVYLHQPKNGELTFDLGSPHTPNAVVAAPINITTVFTTNTPFLATPTFKPFLRLEMGAAFTHCSIRRVLPIPSAPPPPQNEKNKNLNSAIATQNIKRYYPRFEDQIIANPFVNNSLTSQRVWVNRNNITLSWLGRQQEYFEIFSPDILQTRIPTLFTSESQYTPIDPPMTYDDPIYNTSRIYMNRNRNTTFHLVYPSVNYIPLPSAYLANTTFILKCQGIVQNILPYQHVGSRGVVEPQIGISHVDLIGTMYTPHIPEDQFSQFVSISLQSNIVKQNHYYQTPIQSIAPLQSSIDFHPTRCLPGVNNHCVMAIHIVRNSTNLEGPQQQIDIAEGQSDRALRRNENLITHTHHHNPEMAIQSGIVPTTSRVGEKMTAHPIISSQVLTKDWDIALDQVREDNKAYWRDVVVERNPLNKHLYTFHLHNLGVRHVKQCFKVHLNDALLDKTLENDGETYYNIAVYRRKVMEAYFAQSPVSPLNPNALNTGWGGYYEVPGKSSKQVIRRLMSDIRSNQNVTRLQDAPLPAIFGFLDTLAPITYGYEDLQHIATTNHNNKFMQLLRIIPSHDTAAYYEHPFFNTAIENNNNNNNNANNNNNNRNSNSNINLSFSASIAIDAQDLAAMTNNQWSLTNPQYFTDDLFFCDVLLSGHYPRVDLMAYRQSSIHQLGMRTQSLPIRFNSTLYDAYFPRAITYIYNQTAIPKDQENRSHYPYMIKDLSHTTRPVFDPRNPPIPRGAYEYIAPQNYIFIQPTKLSFFNTTLNPFTNAHAFQSTSSGEIYRATSLQRINIEANLTNIVDHQGNPVFRHNITYHDLHPNSTLQSAYDNQIAIIDDDKNPKPLFQYTTLPSLNLEIVIKRPAATDGMSLLSINQTSYILAIKDVLDSVLFFRPPLHIRDNTTTTTSTAGAIRNLKSSSSHTKVQSNYANVMMETMPWRWDAMRTADEERLILTFVIPLSAELEQWITDPSYLPPVIDDEKEEDEEDGPDDGEGDDNEGDAQTSTEKQQKNNHVKGNNNREVSNSRVKLEVMSTTDISSQQTDTNSNNNANHNYNNQTNIKNKKLTNNKQKQLKKKAKKVTDYSFLPGWVDPTQYTSPSIRERVEDVNQRIVQRYKHEQQIKKQIALQNMKNRQNATHRDPIISSLPTTHTLRHFVTNVPPTAKSKFNNKNDNKNESLLNQADTTQFDQLVDTTNKDIIKMIDTKRKALLLEIQQNQQQKTEEETTTQTNDNTIQSLSQDKSDVRQDRTQQQQKNTKKQHFLLSHDSLMSPIYIDLTDVNTIYEDTTYTDNNNDVDRGINAMLAYNGDDNNNNDANMNTNNNNNNSNQNNAVNYAYRKYLYNNPHLATKNTSIKQQQNTRKKSSNPTMTIHNKKTKSKNNNNFKIASTTQAEQEQSPKTLLTHTPTIKLPDNDIIWQGNSPTEVTQDKYGTKNIQLTPPYPNQSKLIEILTEIVNMIYIPTMEDVFVRVPDWKHNLLDAPDDYGYYQNLTIDLTRTTSRSTIYTHIYNDVIDGSELSLNCGGPHAPLCGNLPIQQRFIPRSTTMLTISSYYYNNTNNNNTSNNSNTTNPNANTNTTTNNNNNDTNTTNDDKQDSVENYSIMDFAIQQNDEVDNNNNNNTNDTNYNETNNTTTDDNDINNVVDDNNDTNYNETTTNTTIDDNGSNNVVDGNNSTDSSNDNDNNTNNNNDTNTNDDHDNGNNTNNTNDSNTNNNNNNTNPNDDGNDNGNKTSTEELPLPPPPLEYIITTAQLHITSYVPYPYSSKRKNNNNNIIQKNKNVLQSYLQPTIVQQELQYQQRNIAVHRCFTNYDCLSGYCFNLSPHYEHITNIKDNILDTFSRYSTTTTTTNKKVDKRNTQQSFKTKDYYDLNEWTEYQHINNNIQQLIPNNEHIRGTSFFGALHGICVDEVLRMI